MSLAKQIKVTQKKSMISEPPAMRSVLKGLGLGRIGRSVTVANTPSFRGMIKKVIHLVAVEEVQ
ncbi:MAG: 50S ribosomal protein L30 [Deltaproteobacteria bacterium]|nr:50S ribosomal protein L30 [Deltaproteobacteria bacterium]